MLGIKLGLGVNSIVRLHISELQALITSLFSSGENGALYVPQPIVNGEQALFQDSAGTLPVTADGDPNGLMIDQSPNSINATQSTSAARPTYNANPDRLSLDKVDDALIITVPAGGWTGTMVLATDDGTASYGISIPAGAYALGGQFFPGNAIVGAVFRDGALTASEKSDAESYFVANGATASYGTVTSFTSYWEERSEITAFPLIDTSSGTDFNSAWEKCTSLISFPLIDTSNATSLSQAWEGCSSLTSFPLIDTSSVTNFFQPWIFCSSLVSFPLIDTSKGTNFLQAWAGCSSLTSFPAINTSSATNLFVTWENCSSLTSFPLINVSNVINCERAWNNCSSLTNFPADFFDNIQTGRLARVFENTNLNQASIDRILVSLVTSGIETGTRVFGQSGGSAPSVGTGQPAIDTLRSRGWTVTVTGGY